MDMNKGAARRRKRTPLYLYVVFLLLLLIAGYSVLAFLKYRSERAAVGGLLQHGMVMETRFRSVGPFFSLFMWCSAVQVVEQEHQRETGRYLHPREIPDGLYRALKTDALARIGRQAVWDEGVLLDSFIPFDEFKARLDRRFGVNFRDVLTGLDSSRFRFDFRELSQGTDYEFGIHERFDVNFDGDADDFFSYRHSKHERGIRFIDRGVKHSLEHFIIEYSRVLDLQYETEQP